MKVQRILISICLFLLCFLSQSILASSHKQKTTSELVDITGQQRMLVHQVLVSYAQIGQVQSFGNPVGTKHSVIKKFENNLNILINEAKITNQIKQMKNIWNQLKYIVLLPPTKEEMIKLVRLNEEIVLLANKSISKLIADSDMDIINISGKQRMLSQRIALFMLMKNWGFDGYSQKMQVSLAQFSIHLKYLKNKTYGNEKISKIINSSKKDYTALIRIIAQDKNEERDYSFSISRYTAQMLRKAKKITKLYVNELKKTGVMHANIGRNSIVYSSIFLRLKKA